MVTIPIHHDTSSVPLMTSLIIDLTVSQPASTTVEASLPTPPTTTAITTTTTLPSPPPQPQQGERLDKQGNRIHQLETQDLSRMIREQTMEYIDKQEIDRKIEETVKEAVTASVQYAMRAPLRARFKDLPTSDIKEIMLQRMLEENYEKGHEDHRMTYKALQTSILRDESKQFDANKSEERKKMKSKQDSPKTPPGSPPPPPPPPLPSGASGASDDQSPGLTAPGSSKIVATTAYTAWTTTTSRFEPSASSIPEDVFMHEESDFAAQDIVSDDEDISNRHIPKTGDIGVFIDWFCKKQGITELTPEHLEGPAYEVVKAFHPDVIHLQFQMEECHKLLTNQVDDRLLKYNVSRPLPLGGPPGQVTIQTKFFFNRDLATIWQQGWFQITYGSKQSACMTFLQLMVSPTSGSGDRNSTSTDTQQKPTEELLSPKPPIAKGQVDSLYCCQLMDQESGYQITGRRLPTRHREDKYGMQMIMHFNEIHKFSDGTLQQIDEALDYQVKEFRVNKVNPGLNTRFWTTNDVIKRKQFMFVIQKRLKLRRIFRNLKSFVGGRIREGDYRLLQRTE
ncbi:hypothetical protein Tco_1410532 [Tanacetum coccineum]